MPHELVSNRQRYTSQTRTGLLLTQTYVDSSAIASVAVCIEHKSFVFEVTEGRVVRAVEFLV